MRASLAIILLVTMVAMGGCSALDSGGSDETAEFTTSVEFPWAGGAGDTVAVKVQVENTGAAGEYEPTLRADGEPVASETVELDANESTRLTLRHSFATPGEYDLAVGDDTRTVQVYDSPAAMFHEADFDVGTRIIAEEASVDAELTSTEGIVEFSATESTTIRKNFTAQTLYERTEATNELPGETYEETVQTWIVNGTEYTQTDLNTTEETFYTKDQSDEFAEVDPEYGVDAVSQYLTTHHDDDEYVFVYDVPESDDASTLLAGLETDNTADLPADRTNSAYIEFHIDRELVRPSSLDMTLSFEPFENYESLELSIE